jgi:hypothetical protein
MSKALCYTGLVVAGVLLLVFGLDLATTFILDEGFPFGGVSLVMDLGFTLAAIVLAYLSWATLREQT